MDPSSTSPRRNQYSLRRIFAVTTAAALVAGVFSQLPLAIAVLGVLLVATIYLVALARRFQPPEFSILLAQWLKVTSAFLIVGAVLGFVLAAIFRL